MGSEFNLFKRRYDLSMSKRTRKPPLKSVEGTNSPSNSDDSNESLGTADHKTLKELMINDGKAVEVAGIPTNKKQNVKLKMENEGDRKREPEKRHRRNSLGYYLKEEEKNLQIVTSKQQGEGIEAAKLGGMVSRYVKVLNHLINVQRHPQSGSRKKPVISSTLPSK